MRVIGSRKSLAVLVVAGAAMVVGLTSNAAFAHMEYRAGVDNMAAGQAGIFITFSQPMPSNKYVISVQQVNDGGYQDTSDCTYLNALKPTATGFQVQLKTCETNTPVKVKEHNLQLRWIVIERTQ